VETTLLCARGVGVTSRFLLMVAGVQWTRTQFALVHNIGKIHVFVALA
jgi:hypothetical protein